jgi:predicted NUDIX family phosphoesterase
MATPNKMDEQILVFAASAVEPTGLAGKTGMAFGVHDEFLGSKGYIETLDFRRRGDVEQDESLKQPIPYWVIVAPSNKPQAEGLDRILCYVRGKKSGENRLVAKASIGIGGHISLSDVEGALWTKGDKLALDAARRLYELGAHRELHEELKITSPACKSRIVALLNDSETPVGRVHFGMVHVLVLADPSGVGPNEEDVITKFSWKSVEELTGMKESLEGWSRICLDNIGPIIQAAKDIAAEWGAP